MLSDYAHFSCEAVVVFTVLLGLFGVFSCPCSVDLQTPGFSYLVLLNLHPLFSSSSLRFSSSHSNVIGYSLGHNFPKGVQTAQYFVSGKVGGLSSWYVCWLGRCGCLASNCSFPFFCFDCGKPIPLHHWRIRPYINLFGLNEFLSIGSSKSYQVVPSYWGDLRSGLI